MELTELHADLAAFADEEGDVAIDNSGSFVLLRQGREIAGRIVEKADGRLLVSQGEAEISYRQFLLNELAGLHLFAERLATRRAPVENYIDGRVEVRRAGEDMCVDGAISMLRRECEDAPPFAARVSFITADAGHGKTALLKQFQYEQAEKYRAGSGDYLFWHVDLQGRQLLRLSEALMGDLGDLRITGLWMPAIVRLMRRRALILGVDGFDELAAEQGSTDALGALAALVSQLGGHGTVVAAARRTFFDTDDYLRRAGVMGRAISSPCEFNQVALLPWRREEGLQYLAESAAHGNAQQAAPAQVYDQVVAALGNDAEHPMLTRPFLLAQVVRALSVYGIAPVEFISAADDPLSGVAAVVQAFVRREVSEKWKTRDTGEPYLSEEQHMQFLADVAEEMYRSQKDRLDLDVVETIAALLLDQWKIDADRRSQILEMVRMHVLLVPPGGDARTRSFDHPEFRDYFIAYALRSHLERVMQGTSARGLAQFLSISQLTDSTARYVCAMLNRSEDRVRAFLSSVESVLRQEWRPTFLQINVGTLLPYVLSGVHNADSLEFSGKAIYSSLVFERSDIQNAILRNGSFVNASFIGVCWRQVVLESCQLGEIVVDDSSNFQEVVFADCSIEGLRVRGDEEEEREYAPQRIWMRLEQLGVSASRQGTLMPTAVVEAEEIEIVRTLRRFLRLFSRTTVVTDDQLRSRFRQDQHAVFDVLLPILERHGVVSENKWKGSGQKRIWGIDERLEDVLAAEGGAGKANLVSFWDEVREVC